jgi:hypothetical protein
MLKMKLLRSLCMGVFPLSAPHGFGSRYFDNQNAVSARLFYPHFSAETITKNCSGINKAKET